MMRSLRLAAPALLAVCAIAQGQSPATPPPTLTSPDSLRLESLQAAAIRTDPRQTQIGLLAQQSSLRLKSIGTDHLPTLAVEGLAQYQSDVARIPITLPNGETPPSPPHDTYDARLIAQQRIFDPTLSSRRSVERAQLAESQARVRNSVYSLRQNVNDAYFTALNAQLRISEIETSVTDLEAQLAVSSARVREGTALPSEANTIRAELLRRRQASDELRATRRASLSVLTDLTGISMDTSTVLAIPDALPAEISAVVSDDDARRRPEYDLFARSRDLIEAQRSARRSQDLPRISAFARTGYGKPGLNPLANSFQTYWLGGVQLQWSPWNWGASDRDREMLAIQSAIVSTEEAAFTAGLRRQVAQDVASVDRLRTTLDTDDSIIALRENILTETRARFNEHVITSAEYVDKQTDVLAARIARASHRVELAQAVARYLTTIGAEVR